MTVAPRRLRGPAALYGVMTIALGILFFTLSLTASAPPPPSIAEFTPQAVQQIKNPPRDELGTTSRNGSRGSGAPGQDSASPSPSASSAAEASAAAAAAGASARVGRKHRCAGNPPRQTIDTQAPACVPFYQGPLPGPGSRGVTANEIRVAVPCSPDTCDTDAFTSTVRDYQTFFNEQFEFYTRALKLVPFKLREGAAAAGAAGPTAQDMIQDAVDMSAQGFFASLPYMLPGADGTFTTVYGNDKAFYDALAKNHIIAIESPLVGGAATQADLAEHAPYQWTYLPTNEMTTTMIGDVVCRALKDLPPTNAGTAVQQKAAATGGNKRKFGLLYPQATASTPVEFDVSPIISAMRECGVPPDLQTYPADEQYGYEPNTQAQLSQFNTDGVTTVIVIGGIDMFALTTVYADSLTYQPEWFNTTYYGLDGQFMATGGEFGMNPTTQQPHMIGTRSRNKASAEAPYYGYQAAKQEDPNYNSCCLPSLYSGLLLLSSGIQTAGPQLNPESFQAGLFSADFPGNATAGAAPDWQSRVFFNHNHRSMQSDFALQYVDPNSENVEFAPRTGAFCHINHGQRWAPGTLRGPVPFNNSGNGGCDGGVKPG